MVKGASERRAPMLGHGVSQRGPALLTRGGSERRAPMLGHGGRSAWLSITPEPERELPRAVATLAQGGEPSPSAVEAETTRIERLVLHGNQREWLRYLHGVVELIEGSAADPDQEVQRARRTATAVISNHHNLLLGLPGRGAQLSAADRVKLAQLTSTTAK